MIELRASRDSDRAQIIARFADLFGAEPAAEADLLWDWQWRDDPRLARAGLVGSVIVSGETIIGNMSFVPAGLFIHGRPVAAHWGVSAMVHAGRMRKALQEERAGRAMAADTEAETGESKAQGSKRLSWAARLATHYSATDILLGKHVGEKMLKESLKTGFRLVEGAASWFHRLSLTPRLSRAVGPALGRVIAALPNAVTLRLPKPRRRVEIMRGDFDARFDALWEEARTTYPAISIRDARTLQWRYRRRPGTAYVVLTLSDGDRLRGYAVMRTIAAGKLLRGKIVDVLAALDDPATRRDLLAASLRTLRGMGADKAMCFATHSALTESLRECGFSPHAIPDPLSAQNLPQVQPYFTEGDGDGA